jgi:heme/copper-type cytochrome/quinol oxidase subunit 3
MSATTPTPAPAGHGEVPEEAGFYHDASLNAAWTGSRLAVGGLTFLFGAFAFAYFYLRTTNSNGRWEGSGYSPPSMAMGVTIMLLVLASAGVHWVVLQRIKAGSKRTWQAGATIALVLGVAAVGLQIAELLSLPFQPGASGFSSVFTAFYPVLAVILLAALLWLEGLLMRSRSIPAISFVEQPPTYTEAFALQRFQASLSGFTVVWNYLAIVAVVFWFLFYVG